MSIRTSWMLGSFVVTGILLPQAKAEPVEKPPVVKVSVSKKIDYVNVMGNDMPKFPEFPKLEKKAGFVRGYVKDAAGNPLQGAVIGIRSTAVGGRYSGADCETDEKGYYELEVPVGAAHFYAAGYTVDYAEGRAGLSLHPVDGKLESFASKVGSVENFVLLSHGVTSRDNLSEKAYLSSTYYGGTLYIGHFLSDPGDINALPSNIKEGSEVEVTLTPEGKLLDGNVGKTIIVKKSVYSSGFKIHNIPVGTYKLSIKLADGKPLRTRLIRPQNTPFGIVPEETSDSMKLNFYPNGAKAATVLPQYGAWNSVEMYIEMPVKK
jgi:hypothetical protein